MVNGITLILGGARSGKSAFAERIAAADGRRVTYLATADSRDAEMAERIAIHKSRRPASWKTWEGDPEDLPEAVASMSGVLLLDCLTMWLTRQFLKCGAAEDKDEQMWEREENNIRACASRLFEAPSDKTHLVIVSNEIGLGLVPPYLMGRRFRDLQGRVNQLCAKHAARGAIIAAGYPIWFKGNGDGLGV